MAHALPGAAAERILRDHYLGIVVPDAQQVAELTLRRGLVVYAQGHLHVYLLVVPLGNEVYLLAAKKTHLCRVATIEQVVIDHVLHQLAAVADAIAHDHVAQAQVLEVILLANLKDTLAHQVVALHAVQQEGVAQIARVGLYLVHRHGGVLRFQIVADVLGREQVADVLREEADKVLQKGRVAQVVAPHHIAEHDGGVHALEVFVHHLVAQGQVREIGQAAIAHVEVQAAVLVRQMVELEELGIAEAVHRALDVAAAEIGGQLAGEHVGVRAREIDIVERREQQRAHHPLKSGHILHLVDEDVVILPLPQPGSDVGVQALGRRDMAEGEVLEVDVDDVGRGVLLPNHLHELEEQEENKLELHEQKESEEQKLKRLRAEYQEISENLDSMYEEQVKKEEEITTKMQILEQAKEKQKKQYEDMKKRIQYMYEKPQQSLLSMFFEDFHLAKLLNRVDQVIQIQEYDRAQLAHYKKLAEELEIQQKELEKAQVELKELIVTTEAKQEQVVSLREQTKVSISQYLNEIAQTEIAIGNTEDALEKKSEALQELYAKAQEEEEATRRQQAQEDANRLQNAIASGGIKQDESGIVYGNMTLTQEEMEMLTAMIYCESRGEPYEGQLAVGHVIMNRVRSSKFPNTLEEVLRAGRQFEPAGSGRFDIVLTAYRENIPGVIGAAEWASCKKAAEACVNGESNVGECLFFRTHKPVPQLAENLEAAGVPYWIIENHIFYYSWVNY